MRWDLNIATLAESNLKISERLSWFVILVLLKDSGQMIAVFVMGYTVENFMQIELQSCSSLCAVACNLEGDPVSYWQPVKITQIAHLLSFHHINSFAELCQNRSTVCVMLTTKHEYQRKKSMPNSKHGKQISVPGM